MQVLSQFAFQQTLKEKVFWYRNRIYTLSTYALVFPPMFLLDEVYVINSLYLFLFLLYQNQLLCQIQIINLIPNANQNYYQLLFNNSFCHIRLYYKLIQIKQSYNINTSKNPMGNQQPRKIKPVTKIQIEVASTKSKFHLQLMRDRKNAQIVKAQKQLVAKIKSQNRNKVEQILIAQRIINALKYSQACNFLMSYCASIKSQANFIAQNLNNPVRLQPFLIMIYSLLYAAQTLGLSSLKQFRDLMKALNDPASLPNYTNQQIKTLLCPQPTPHELNMYFLEMSERNNLPLQEINIIGHKFSVNLDQKPSNQPTFSQIQRKLAQQLNKKMANKQAGQGINYGGMGGFNGNQGFNPNQGYGANQGYNGQGFNGNQGFNNNPNFTPNQGQSTPNQGFNPNSTPGQGGFGSNQGYTPSNYGNNNFIPPGMSKPYQNSNVHDSNPYGFRDTYKAPATSFGPQFYTPGQINSNKDIPKPYMPTTQSRMSIKDINDIAYFPQIQPLQETFKVEPSFQALCQKIKTGL